MGNRFSGSIVIAPIVAVAAGAVISLSVSQTSAQAPVGPGPAQQTAVSNAAPLKTAWGEPDLQGIWTEEFDTPLQRPARYGNQEFLTEAQRQELNRQRAAH